jgi:hypothetical protein
MPFASQGAPVTAQCGDILTPGSLRVRVGGLGLCRLYIDGVPIALPPVPIITSPETTLVRRVLVEGVPSAVVGDEVAFHLLSPTGLGHGPVPSPIPTKILPTQTRVNIG